MDAGIECNDLQRLSNLYQQLENSRKELDAC
jgi:hypothetical protein